MSLNSYLVSVGGMTVQQASLVDLHLASILSVTGTGHSLKARPDEGQLPTVQTLLPCHTKQWDDVISTETKEASGNKQCYQMLLCATVRSLGKDWRANLCPQEG